MRKNPEDRVSQDIVCMVPIISMELQAESKPWNPDQLDSENTDLDLLSVQHDLSKFNKTNSYYVVIICILILSI